MLHRVKKEADANKNKWIGIGGKLEKGESPEMCLLREVREETGIILEAFEYRGVIDFQSDLWEEELMHLYTAPLPAVSPDAVLEFPCSEGRLEWVKKEKVPELPIWEGDRIFLNLLLEDAPFFRLALRYEGEKLRETQLEKFQKE